MRRFLRGRKGTGGVLGEGLQALLGLFLAEGDVLGALALDGLALGSRSIGHSRSLRRSCIGGSSGSIEGGGEGVGVDFGSSGCHGCVRGGCEREGFYSRLERAGVR